MISYFKDLWEIHRKKVRNDVLEQDAIGNLFQEASNIVTDRPDTDGFVRIQETDQQKGHLEPNQLEMVRKARKFYRWEPNARGAISTLVNYIMGRGISITPKSQDPTVWYVWREFWTADRNRMQMKQFEIPLRWLRDGEAIIEFFDKDDNGKPMGKSTVRFIDPLLLKNPGGVGTVPSGFSSRYTRKGIEYDPNDIERPIRYWVRNRENDDYRSVDARNVVHIKFGVDSDSLRGETQIQPIMQMLTQYDQWLQNRILLNKMRTAIVMIKKVTGTPSQVQSIADTFQTAKRLRSGEDKKQQIKGGTTITAGPGVDYKMESPNINASDVKDDGRNIKLNMAAGTNLPEYVFGDASNANFASTMISEAPFVKFVQYLQMVLEYGISQIYKKVIQNAVDGGLIEAPNDEDFLRRLKNIANLTEQSMNEADEDGTVTKREQELRKLMPNGKMETPTEIFFGCDMQWPEIIHRDVKEHTEALQIARAQGWISDPTASASLGFDYNEEVRKQKLAEADGKTNGNPLAGLNPEQEKMAEDEDDLDAEVQNVLKSLTDEEKQIITQKSDPKDIAQLLLSKIGVGANGGQ